MKNNSLLAFLEARGSPSKEEVWSKAIYCDEVSEAKGFRKDDNGNWIHRDQYGNRENEYGWEFDHVIPVSLGGHGGLGNIRPLHWKANARKSDTPPGLFELARARSGGSI